MRAFLLISAMLASQSCAAGLMDPVLPITTLLPVQQADGSRVWRFVMQHRNDLDEAMIMWLVGAELTKAHWCADGWEITSRVEAMKNVSSRGGARRH